MKRYILAFAFAFCAHLLFGQSQLTTTDVKIGDVFEIGTPETSTYKHIDFPRPNMIIKRGGIANYKSVQGYKVVVTAVKKLEDGTIAIKIKRKDGGRFFGSHSIIEADVQAALKTGELRQ